MTHIKRFAGAILTLFVMLLIGGCDDHGKAINESWRKALGITKQDGPYRWYAYPVDNFGVATFYDPPEDKAYVDSDRICATWSCLGIDPASLSEEKRLRVNGYVDVGAGGTVTLTDKQSRQLAANLSIPVLSKLAEIGAGVDFSKEVDATVTIQKAYKRSVDRNRLMQAIAASTNNLLVDGYASGRLVYVAADIVGTGVALSVTTKRSTSPDVKVKLVEALDVLAKDTSLGFKLTSKSDTGGTLTIPHPVILAVQTRKQPGGGVLATSTESGATLDAALPRPPLGKT